MIRTWSMMTAAALMAAGFPLVDSERVNPKRVVFSIDGSSDKEEAERILHLCQHGRCFGVIGDIGKYEQARQVLRDIIDQEEGANSNVRRRT